LETSVIAGQGVEVSALSSVLNGSSPLTLTYRWNLRRRGQRNTTTCRAGMAGTCTTSRARNTITLKITDELGKTSTATSPVTVASDNRAVIYVDTNGSDSNNGSSATLAVKSAARAFALAGKQHQDPVQARQRWSVNQTLMVNGHDIAIGAYGSGAQPGPGARHGRRGG